MNEARLRLGMAGVALDVRGPAAWIAPLRDAWSQWIPAPDVVPWPVSVSPDPSLAASSAPLFETRARCRAGVWSVSSSGFRGKVDAGSGVAHLQAYPRANPADVGYFLRVALAMQAFARGGILSHAAGVLHHEQGYAFFGLSGSGKTTVARYSAPAPVLNDDLLLLWPAADGWRIVATPFGKRRGEVRCAPLRALLRLVKDERVYLELLSRSRALGELVANTPVLSGDAEWLPQVLSRWETLIAGVDICALHFRRDSTFWEAVDAKLG